MHAKVLVAGWLLVSLCIACAQQGRIQFANTSQTLIYTNGCGGSIGLITGQNTYRIGLYVGPLGSAPEALTLVALATNASLDVLRGRFSGGDVTGLPAGSYTFQVRGWALSAGTTFEQARWTMAYAGVSDLGYFQLSSSSTAPPVSLFGTGPGQVGGFELANGYGECRPVAHRRIAPHGPVIITSASHDGVVSWTNLLASNAVYRVMAGPDLRGPFTNVAYVTSSVPHVAFTNSFPMSFVQVAWENPPASTPDSLYWEYQAFDAAGAVMAAGVITFTSNVPSTVTRRFSRIQTSAQNGVVNLHPNGYGTMQATAGTGSNTIHLAYGDFQLRGQMTGNYFAGDWTAIDWKQGTPEDPPPWPPYVIHTGRFVALRWPPF